MARWKLTEKHYLNVPGTRWEFQTIDRMTGRPVRKTFAVPLYLDPENEQDWNWKDQNGYDGGITIAYAGKGEPRDIIFEGDPTPGMLPLDDEAKAISGKFTWKPTQGLDEESQANSFTAQLMSGLIDQMSEAQAKAAAPQPIPGMDKFMEVMTQMMQQNAQLIAAIAGKGVAPQPETIIDDEQQVVDEEPPLPEPEEPTTDEIIESMAQHALGEMAAKKQAETALTRRSIRRI